MVESGLDMMLEHDWTRISNWRPQNKHISLNKHFPNFLAAQKWDRKDGWIQWGPQGFEVKQMVKTWTLLGGGWKKQKLGGGDHCGGL